MDRQRDRRFFFIHIMKTGGATFRQHLFANFPPHEIYPDMSQEALGERPYSDIGRLLALSPERRSAIRIYSGHFPFVAAQLLAEDVTMLTLLRHPVERTISYLKHCKLNHPHHADLSLEQIYDDPWYFPMAIKEHQTKIFSMRTDDELESCLDVIDVDDDRLALACENLERVDVVGLQERYDDFTGELARRFGWRFGTVQQRRVAGGSWSVSDTLRRRIAEDNPADLALYQHAVALWEQRGAVAT